MKKFKSILSEVTCGLIVLTSQLLFAQTDPGIRDTLFVTGCVRGNCAPGTEITITVSGYHDEGLGGISIPLKYKNPQTDVTLDSVRFHPDMNAANLKDSIRDNPAGTIILLFVSFSVIPAGTDTFATLYFTTGPNWDPAIYAPIDTFRIGGPGGQGLSFTDTGANPTDIVPYFSLGSCICSDVKEDNRFPSSLRPSRFSLSQNFPNPFNTETVIAFVLPHSSNVKIEIFNILGQKVKDLVDEKVSAGYKKVVWDGKNNNGNRVSSGIYFYRIMTDEFVDFKKMTLLK